MAINNNENVHLNILQEQVQGYISKCHLPDGGYFFAMMPPSSAMDTYYAVKTLSLLGVEPDRTGEIEDFFINALEKNPFMGINGLFSASEVLYDLNLENKSLYGYLPKLKLMRNSVGGFGAFENLDLEVVSEMETTFRVVSILNRLGRDFNTQPIINFVLKFNNADGGFGNGRISTLASTFYATEIFKLIMYDGTKLKLTVNYLRDRENMWQLNFIEDIYWLSNSLCNLGQRVRIPERLISFVKACQRPNGGFARKDVMGIPTLEDTFYAVSILKTLSYI
ncbi:MAG: prenyltransferase/squalene oxidase repeat-containing protein [Dehalococcoidia bacterium]